MMDAIFDLCVRILVFLAGRTGMSYKEINVWIFVILWPLLTVGLIMLAAVQQRRIRSLETSREGSGVRPGHSI
jgi:hypothetical protein